MGDNLIALSLVRADDGLVILSTETGLAGKFLESEDFFNEGREHTFTNEPEYGLTEDTVTIHVSTPVYAPDGTLAAVLVGITDLAQLSAIMEHRTDLNVTEETYLVNSNNYFVNEPRFGDQFALQKSLDTEGVNTCLSGSNGVSYYQDYRGEPVIGAYQWLPEMGLCILTEIDQKEAYASLDAFRSTVIQVTILSAVVIVILGTLLSGTITGPLSQLTSAVEEFRLGNLAHQIEPGSIDEINSLAASFNSMAVDLDETGKENQQLINELRGWSGELEKRVEERTHELADSREALLKMMGDLEEEMRVRKLTEESLEQNLVELSRSNRDLEQFAHVASHDLQEPLRMVTSYLQLIEQRYEGKLDEDADDFIHFAVDGAIRMKQLITDLLSFSKLGKQGEKLEVLSTQQIFEEVRDDIKIQIEETDAALTCDPLPEVLADKIQLKQLFQNLISNAIKFSGEASPIVHISADRLNGEWEFSIKDNGIGIDPQFFDRIFVIFQRLHSKHEYGGTGIGLAICKKIVEWHGGRIWVESSPGQGATFFFTLKTIGGSDE